MDIRLIVYYTIIFNRLHILMRFQSSTPVKLLRENTIKNSKEELSTSKIRPSLNSALLMVLLTLYGVNKDNKSSTEPLQVQKKLSFFFLKKPPPPENRPSMVKVVLSKLEENDQIPEVKLIQMLSTPVSVVQNHEHFQMHTELSQVRLETCHELSLVNVRGSLVLTTETKTSSLRNVGLLGLATGFISPKRIQI